jgi:hypothetical protein
MEFVYLSYYIIRFLYQIRRIIIQNVLIQYLRFKYDTYNLPMQINLYGVYYWYFNYLEYL